MNLHWHMNMYFYTHSLVCGLLWASGLEWSKHRRAEGRRASGVLWWGLFRGVKEVFWGGWDGQDRLSSLPPVCHGWIGDYSSRCVIRSELYSCGCRVRRERLGGTGITFHWRLVNLGDVPSGFLTPPTHTLTLLVSSPSRPRPPSCLSMALLDRKLPKTNAYTYVRNPLLLSF